jgi:hypothetical protein
MANLQAISPNSPRDALDLLKKSAPDCASCLVDAGGDQMKQTSCTSAATLDLLNTSSLQPSNTDGKVSCRGIQPDGACPSGTECFAENTPNVACVEAGMNPSKGRGVECLGVGMCMPGMQCSAEGTPGARCVVAGMVGPTGNANPALPPQCANGAFQKAKDDSDAALQMAGCGPDTPFGKVRVPCAS